MRAIMAKNTYRAAVSTASEFAKASLFSIALSVSLQM
jgi:hypothetical protein